MKKAQFLAVLSFQNYYILPISFYISMKTLCIFMYSEVSHEIMLCRISELLGGYELAVKS